MKEIKAIKGTICYDLSNENIINEMDNIINKSEKIKKEIGFNIDKNYNITDYCEGHKCSLKIKKTKKPVGNFHTHPISGYASFSNSDLKDAFIKNYDFSCVGAKDEDKNYINYIKCINIDKDKEYIELHNKYKEFKKIEKKYMKSDSKTKLKMLQKHEFRKHDINKIIDFMNKQRTCLIKTRNKLI